jgi:uncharacterized protein
MASPCVQRCEARDDRCLGCGRTLSEIGRWSSMTEVEQLAIMATLTARTLASPSPVVTVIPGLEQPESVDPASTHVCPGCGKPAYCAVSAGKEIDECWCSQLPALPMSDAPACWCQACLGKALHVEALA